MMTSDCPFHKVALVLDVKSLNIRNTCAEWQQHSCADCGPRSDKLLQPISFPVLFHFAAVLRENVELGFFPAGRVEWDAANPR